MRLLALSALAIPLLFISGSMLTDSVAVRFGILFLIAALIVLNLIYGLTRFVVWAARK
jgi:hypothetical protein